MSRISITTFIAALALAAPPALADFEGRLDYSITSGGTTHGMGGRAQVWIGPSGSRSELDLKMGEGGKSGALKLTTLSLRAEPGITYLLNDGSKTYAVVDARSGGGGARWGIERLGPDTVAGYRCERVRLTRSEGGHGEGCFTRSLGQMPITALQSDPASGLSQALTKAGVDGVPVRWTQFSEKNEKAMTMELVAARAERVAPQRLTVPPGYAKVGIMAVMVPPEKAKEVDAAMARAREAVKNLPPEQRRQMEKMLSEQYGEATR